MTRKSRRLAILVACGVGLGSATALCLAAFRSDIVFFVAPSDMAEKGLPGRSLRLGGLVEPGSVHRVTEGGEPVAHFRVPMVVPRLTWPMRASCRICSVRAKVS